MKEYQIKWRQGDYVRLGQAISQFNKHISEIRTEENKLFLPEIISYKEQKERIVTRKELNSYINSLRKFTNETGKNLYETEAGEKITKWEYKELERRRKTAISRITEDIKLYNEPTQNGFSRVQMGDITTETLKATINSLNKFEKLKGYEFRQLKERIFNIGASDYKMRRSIVYKENMMNSIKELKDIDPSYEKLYNYLNKYNPLNFFEITQKSQVLIDFFEWYKSPEDYGNFQTSEEFVDYIIEELK